jgi:hypothetical protein
MKPEKQDDDLRLLERTIDNMGIEVRRGSFDSEGGLVKIKGRHVLFVRAGIGQARQRSLYLDALRALGAAAVHVPPRVRQMLGEKEWE